MNTKKVTTQEHKTVEWYLHLVCHKSYAILVNKQNNQSKVIL